jgi:hypothetical protein
VWFLFNSTLSPTLRDFAGRDEADCRLESEGCGNFKGEQRYSAKQRLTTKMNLSPDNRLKANKVND